MCLFPQRLAVLLNVTGDCRCTDDCYTIHCPLPLGRNHVRWEAHAGSVPSVMHALRHLWLATVHRISFHATHIHFYTASFFYRGTNHTRMGWCDIKLKPPAQTSVQMSNGQLLNTASAGQLSSVQQREETQCFLKAHPFPFTCLGGMLVKGSCSFLQPTVSVSGISRISAGVAAKG